MKLMINDILLYIQDHVFLDDLQVKDIASHFGYDKYYFSREFKKQTGYSLNEYISSLRSEKAIDLIDGEHNITDIQSTVGYSSSGSFSNLFKRYTGSSPKQHRQERDDIYAVVKAFEDSGTDSVKHTEHGSGSSCFVSVEFPQHNRPGLLFIGLFHTPIPNHRPISGIATKNPEANRLEHIPVGEYYLLACAVSPTGNLLSYFNLKHCLRGRAEEKLVFPECSGKSFTIRLRPPLPEDPPILINLAKLLVTASQKNHNVR